MRATERAADCRPLPETGNRAAELVPRKNLIGCGRVKPLPYRMRVPILGGFVLQVFRFFLRCGIFVLFEDLRNHDAV